MEKYKGISDEELIRRFRSGEKEIMDFILEKYKPMVRKKTKLLYLIGGENDDLIQEGMIGLFKAARDYNLEKDSSFYHFADLCVSRQLATAMEASNRKKHSPLNNYISFSAEEKEAGVSMEEIFSVDEDSPERLFIEKECLDEFNSKIQSNLSKMENQVLKLYLAGNDYNQIAKIMGKPSKSIDNALQRIRQKVRIIQ